MHKLRSAEVLVLPKNGQEFLKIDNEDNLSIGDERQQGITSNHNQEDN